MEHVGRFGFPGFGLVKVEDTSTHQIEIGTLQEGDTTFVLKMIRNVAHPNLNFLVSSVSIGEKVVWDFRLEGFKGVGVLAKAGDTIVITFVGNGKFGKVERVIPLNQLSGVQPLGLIGQMALKREAAAFLGRDYELTENELKIEAAHQKRQNEKQGAAARIAAAAAEAAHRDEQIAREAAAAAREIARQERVQKLLTRGQVVGYSAAGQRRHGVPVLESEWLSLPNGTYVVIVDSIDETTGKIGNLLEAFQVTKERGKNPRKGFPVSVSAPAAQSQTVKTTAAARYQPVGNVIIERGEDAFEVFLYPSMEVIRDARANGLNGGTLVAVDGSADPIGKIQVYAVHADRIDTVGLFKPL